MASSTQHSWRFCLATWTRLARSSFRVRRRRKGGPLIRDLAQNLRDEHHLFPDGLTTLQRAYRILSLEKKTSDGELSPYALNKGRIVWREEGRRR